MDAELRAGAASASAELALRESWRLERDRLAAEHQQQQQFMEGEVTGCVGVLV